MSKEFFFHCYHSYLYFVQVSLVSMPQVMKVDSVWTTLVETPHPSLKTKDKILLVLVVFNWQLEILVTAL